MRDCSEIRIVPLNGDENETEILIVFIAMDYAKESIRKDFEHEALLYNDVGIPGLRIKELMHSSLISCKQHYKEEEYASKDVFEEFVQYFKDDCRKINEKERYRIIKITDDQKEIKFEQEKKQENRLLRFINRLLKVLRM